MSKEGEKLEKVSNLVGEGGMRLDYFLAAVRIACSFVGGAALRGGARRFNRSGAVPGVLTADCVSLEPLLFLGR